MLQTAAYNFETFTDVSKSIFENPELGMQEYRSAGLLKDLLRVNGFTVEEGVAGMPTAFLATYGTGKLVIGFSAEYDCLPGLSQKVTVQRAPYTGHLYVACNTYKFLPPCIWHQIQRG